MNKTRERDEHLEQLWYTKEEGGDSIDALKSDMGDSFGIDIIDDLVSKDMAELKIGKSA